ncbi:MAG TPA: methylmalonyl-CoA epimerase [Mesotoga sp.]|jgi:methylmalonyl-CoA/ethylmalonyl-CoA epimerase|nr:methylmalonyl-CoA epimerase [Mesotoga sp.]MDI9374762.1 methylmalonyl-CoA epimerase [Thermotogota bacterium]NLX34807.1 methylmalonyl-CoA epimerase [Thermotogaceae bacterium]MDD4040790.1 methylmalonyl-CoA epimerase [Mesotoga sp.]MDD4477850.1 methylmalonyl-CoA epimerase [Mesotoga sp.]
MRADRIDHIGVAVKSIEERLKVYRDLLKLDPVKIEELPERGLRVAFVNVGDTRIELLEPIAENSQVSKFLETRGEGIHHMAFHVDDIEAAIKEAVELEIVPLTKEAQPGASGTRVVFLHPKSAGGVLIELVEGSH